MPRHLISGTHEWINEIPTVPIYYLAKPQPRERSWENQQEKKTLLSLTDAHTRINEIPHQLSCKITAKGTVGLGKSACFTLRWLLWL